MTPFGFLNINKPSGMTSRQVVDQVQWVVPRVKIGHAGTLDPLATGVLVVGLGQATRLFEYLQRMTKSYRGTFLLGQSSTTEDVEGEITAVAHAPRPTREALVAAAASLSGEILQRPPAYSAIKVDGRRSYALARAGKPVELAARPIRVDQFDIVEYDYPQVVVDVACSSGTYVRSLGRDLAEAVGTAAVMSALVRTAIGPFTLETAVELEAIDAESYQRLLLSPVLAVRGIMPERTVDDDQAQRLSHGLGIDLGEAGGPDEVAAHDAGGHLVAVLSRRDDGLYRPAKYFPQSA